MTTDSGRHMRRNVRLLSGCFALMTTGNVVVVSVSALVGFALADNKALATLPAALMWVSTALAAVPASFLMRRFGRRLGFMTGAVIGVVGATLGCVAVSNESFALLCLAVIVVGAYNGFNFYFRFAAADVASGDYRSRAISLVMAGGVVAAFLGPRISEGANDLFLPTLYFGPFVAVGFIALSIFTLVSFVDIPKPSTVQLRGGRPISVIARQPVFLVAVMSAAVAYGVMVMLMSVTPLVMVRGGHAFGDATFVIQWHVLAMFAPSFVTGHLIRRFGVLTVMAWGAVFMAASIGVALQGVTIPHFLWAMCLLGLGWNFLFVGATTLVTEAHTTAERAKSQAMNEFTVFISASIGSFLSGSLHYYVGWQVLNISALPPVIVLFVAILWLARRRRLEE
ncbi:MAG: MFS transporter [Alphaproteobacteria bacterium]